MWKSVGSLAAFGYSAFLCTETKLFILTSFLGAGIAGFLAVEFRQRALQKKKQTPAAESSDAIPASESSLEGTEEKHSDQAQTVDTTSGQTNHVYQNDAMCLDDDVWVTSFWGKRCLLASNIGRS